MSGDLFDKDEKEAPPADWPARRTASSGSADSAVRRPLADRLRPQSFGEFLGQEKLVGEGAPLRRLIESDRVPSMIFWGPPGSGKTTLASIIARATDSDFLQLSAVSSGVKDVRGVVETAKLNRQYARRTILFVDEIHRFNKAQQDAFLPHVESGLITLIGATTENPSFSVISALLSRSRVYTLEPLGAEHLRELLERALAMINDEPGVLLVEAGEEAFETIVALCDGDGRRAAGLLETACEVARDRAGEQEAETASIGREEVLEVAQRTLMYDRAGEEHFNIISALHKTIRSSDPHGAAYWCERMLAGGEDPRYVLRRLIRVAAEDVGLADPNAVQQAVACMTAYEKLGQPEGSLFVTQLAIYLAVTPKSDAVYRAGKKAQALVQEKGTLAVPLHLRNAPTSLMKEIGYSEGYTYDHDAEGHFVPKQGLPGEIEGTAIYEPTDLGREKAIRERLAAYDAARAEEMKNRNKGRKG